MQSLQLMLDQLESTMLQTCLAPLRTDRRGWSEYGMKRVNLSENPRWYKTLCSQHASSRGVRRGKFDTRVRRANVLSTLRRLIKGRAYAGCKYEGELRQIARRMAA